MGKAALDAPRGETTFKVAPTNLVIIGRDTDDGPEHILWVKRCKQAASRELAMDILERGILEPVLVRRNGTTIEVIAGRRRTAAARLAEEIRFENPEKYGATEVRVPCIRKAGDDKQLFGMIAAENAQREDLDTLEQAHEIARAISLGLTESEIAVTYGVHKQTIKNRLQLLDADTAVKDAVRGGFLPATAALKLAALDKTEQVAAMAELLQRGDTSGEAAARAVRNRKAQKNGNGPEYEPPGRRLLKRIVEHETATEAIDPSALRAIRWMLGETPPSQIKGLSALIASIEAGD